MRRFSRKMQSSGIVRRVRSLRYHKRNVSKAKQKQEALTKIERTKKYMELFKEGRKTEQKKGRR
jgi:hypothetical protein